MRRACLRVIIKPCDAIDAAVIGNVFIEAPLITNEHDNKRYTYHTGCETCQVDERKQSAFLKNAKKEGEIVFHVRLVS